MAERDAYVLILELFDAAGEVHQRIERLVGLDEATQISDEGGPLCRVTVRRALVLPGGKSRPEMSN